MTISRAGFERLRAALNTELGDDETRILLFASLSKWGPRVPETRDEMMAFLRGPVRRRLVEQLGHHRSIAVLIEAENALAVVDSDDDAPLRRRPSTFPPGPVATRTWTLEPVTDGPVQVLVLSANPDFSEMIKNALGSSFVQTRPTAQPQLIPKLLQDGVDLILVDATSPPAIQPLALAQSLAIAPRHATPAIWGAEQRFGEELTRALEATGTSCIPIPSKEGIVLFVDLVRSRKA